MVFDATNEALIKYLTVEYTTIQIAFVRSLVMAAVAVIIILVTRRPELFHTSRLGLLSVRGLLSAVAIVAFYLSLANLDLADAYTLSMAGPIFLAMLSGWLLGEKVPLVRWASVIIGMAGVIFLMRPGAGLFNIWAFTALLSALFYALGMIVNRKLTATEHSLTILFYLGTTSGIMLLIALPMDWVDPPIDDLPLLLLSGGLDFCMMYMFMQAYRYAAAHTIISFDYLAVFYILLAGFIAFAEVPTWNLMIGIAILIASGLITIGHEMHTSRSSSKKTEP